VRKLAPWVFCIALLLLALALLDQSCRSNVALKQAKSDYAELKRITEADHAIQQGIILKAEETIAQKDEEIVRLNASVAHKQTAINQLNARLAEVVGQEPAQPELETQPLVINLRLQIKFLNGLVESNLGIIGDKDRIIQAWESRFNAQVDISEAWKKRYENEHALRVQAEKLFTKSEHARKSNRLTGFAVGLGAGLIAGYIVGK
jgi:hypothetical protein